MYFIFNVCYIPLIPLSSKSSAEEMRFFHFLPPVRKKVISSGRNSTLASRLLDLRNQHIGDRTPTKLWHDIATLRQQPEVDGTTIQRKQVIYREFTEINKHKKKLQIYIQQLMAAHIVVDNGYLKIE